MLGGALAVLLREVSSTGICACALVLFIGVDVVVALALVVVAC